MASQVAPGNLYPTNSEEIQKVERYVVGAIVGDADGAKVGDFDGDDDGTFVGDTLGFDVGLSDGDVDGDPVGFDDGVVDGIVLGVVDGDAVAVQITPSPTYPGPLHVHSKLPTVFVQEAFGSQLLSGSPFSLTATHSSISVHGIVVGVTRAKPNGHGSSKQFSLQKSPLSLLPSSHSSSSSHIPSPHIDKRVTVIESIADDVLPQPSITVYSISTMLLLPNSKLYVSPLAAMDGVITFSLGC